MIPIKNDNYGDVVEFHDKFGLNPGGPIDLLKNIDPEMLNFRYQFLVEECDEFFTAVAENDPAGALDAMIDLVYVAMGNAILMGVTPQLWQRAWDEVQRANMNKVRAEKPEDSKRGTTYDVVKPPGWTPPDIQKCIDEQEY